MILDNDNDRRALMGLLPEAGDILEQNEMWNILELPFLVISGRPIIFRKSGLTDLFIQGRSLPISQEFVFNQDLYTSEGNQPKIIDFGDDIEENSLVQININNLSEDLKNQIKSWFKSAQINGAEGSFTMINEDGEGKTVRLWSDKLSMTVDDTGLYSAFFVLRGE